MSYEGISIKEAMESINANVNGWFLPAEQRRYVWGSRYEGELYICKLFDSLLRKYPIGSLIIWNTPLKVEYREFMTDYHDQDFSRIVEMGRWGKEDKWLVYDGQQRLQTIFSCLRYTFNEKVLIYNLLFDSTKEDMEPDETGFSFLEKNHPEPRGHIRMNKLFSESPKEKTRFRKELLNQWEDLSEKEKDLLENNFDVLWSVFVERDAKSLAIFRINHERENMVNEIFQRLNMGGVALSQSDLLFSRIKGDVRGDFEEILQDFSDKIYFQTGNGYRFSSGEILQLIHLISKGMVRVDPKKIKTKDLAEFDEIWKNLEKPLADYFVDFLWGQFKINREEIIPRKRALLPMLVFFFESYRLGGNFKKFSRETIFNLKQYLISSQINDWNLQGIIDQFAMLTKKAAKENSGFPLKEMKLLLEKSKRRNTEIFESIFMDYWWFSLKILMPQRVYQFDPDSKGRFNPEIDHIFPKKLKAQDQNYYDGVDVIWNMQPIKGDINNFKKRRHPKEFFSNDEGSKYLSQYDFLPKTDLSDDLWDQPLSFIEERKKLMKVFLKQEYGLELK